MMKGFSLDFFFFFRNFLEIFEFENFFCSKKEFHKFKEFFLDHKDTEVHTQEERD